MSTETHTRQSIEKLGEEHGRAGYAPLTRRSFETDAFYTAYMAGYDRGKPRPQLPNPVYSVFGDGPFYPSGYISGSGLLYGVIDYQYYLGRKERYPRYVP